MSFPSGWFFIESKCQHAMVLDIPVNSSKEIAKVVVMPRKDGCATQLWKYDNGFIINKHSKLVLDVQGGFLENDVQVIQYNRKMIEDAHNQRWHYGENGLIYTQGDPDLVLDIRQNRSRPGTEVILYESKIIDNENQLWTLVPANDYLFDIVPLRIIPPVFLGFISYYMVGLVEEVPEFLKFLPVLVLLNLIAAALCLAIGVEFKNLSMAKLLSCMVLLFSMLFLVLFAGLLLIGSLLNKVLLVNKMLYLQLVEERNGLNIDVPDAAIFSNFEFNAQNYLPDVIRLGSMLLFFTVFAFIWIDLFVKEKR